MKSVLICPVCKGALSRYDKRFACPKGHSFDIAKHGYVNLLLGNAGQHGDNTAMIAARHAFLSRGFYDHLAQGLKEAIKRLPLSSAPAVLDIGTGECYYLEAVKQALEEKAPHLYGFDISKQALRFGAKRALSATLFVASAYHMPIADASIDLALLFFSPYAKEECLRVLKKGGYFILAIPAERHLWELKSAIYDTPYLNTPADFTLDGFTLLEQRHIERDICLSSQEDIQALFQMTPYYYKTSAKDQEKVKALESLTVKTAFELLVYQKNESYMLL
ncbi:MAG: methyltransferase domain-containing protein [Clostridia bacterium]|nr:methyltransferase domain-containing protein [Clostridia bacterium]